MFQENDLEIICCPKCKADFEFNDDQLICKTCKAEFPVTDGIPRLLYFDDDQPYNQMWDYKWSVLDGGKGYNYRIIDTADPAYELHNVFRYFDNQNALRDVKDAVAIDVGCGTGQYSVSLLERGAKRVYAIDLTRGVDVGRKIFQERFPHLAGKVVFIQANAQYLPIKSNVIDLGMGLASLHHSGVLPECVKDLVRTIKIDKRFFIWIYAKPVLQIGDENRTIKGVFKNWARAMAYLYTELIYLFLSSLPNDILVLILKFYASNFVYFFYKLRLPVVGRIFKYFLIPGIGNIDDPGYRLINLYDAYSPTYTECSDESDVIEWSKKMKFFIIHFVSWRLGWVGEKKDVRSAEPAYVGLETPLSRR